MNGAESLVKTLLAGGVDVCFANPGTSEMHFVAALDAHADMRCILGLEENIVTGAADGYGRMTGKPAATLLHLGPGLGNGLSNLHNARKSRTPIINVVGEHATYHVALDAPLTADIEGIAGPVSHWVHTGKDAAGIAADGAEAIRQANTWPGRIATLILPADTAWGDAPGVATISMPPAPAAPAADTVDGIAEILGSGEPAIVLLGGRALTGDGPQWAGRIAAASGADLIAEMSNARVDRGAGRVAIDKIPYPVDQALERFKPYRHIILVGAREPVSFFAYPGKPSRLAADGASVHTLAGAEEDTLAALEMLAEALGAHNAEPPVAALDRPERPAGPLTPESIAAAVACLLPDEAIVTDESITTGRAFFPSTETTALHSWLSVVGGSIGIGPPLATGAAIACPNRKVVSLQADGSALYTPQALWTQAREGLDVTTIIFSNRAYRILQGEMKGVGVENPGPRARDMMELDRPAINWPALAQGFGVEAGRAEDAEGLCREIERGLASDGPYLIEAVL